MFRQFHIVSHACVHWSDANYDAKTTCQQALAPHGRAGEANGANPPPLHSHISGTHRREKYRERKERERQRGREKWGCQKSPKGSSSRLQPVLCVVMVRAPALRGASLCALPKVEVTSEVTSERLGSGSGEQSLDGQTDGAEEVVAGVAAGGRRGQGADLQV